MNNDISGENGDYSSFSIAPGDLQITFDYFYFLGYNIHESEDSLGKRSTIESEIEKNADCYDRRNWKDSEAAHNMRNNFLSDLIIDHFHLKPEEIFSKDELTFTVRDSLNGSHQFAISSGYSSNQCGLDSIAAIECSILKNGHLVLSIRVMYAKSIAPPFDAKIPSYSVVDLIKKPELIRSHKKTHSGDLIIKLEDLVKKVEKRLDKILRLKKLLRNEIGVGVGECLPSHPIVGSDSKDNKSTRSRPFIGILFRFSNVRYSQVEFLVPSIRKFVIAAARTTPVFSTMFIDEEMYLAERDIYTPGRSIVYIARRGWCIFDSEEQDRETFMLGAVESTHMVISAIFSTSRSWRMYISDCEKSGKPIFLALNKVINKFFAGHRDLNFRSFAVFSTIAQLIANEKNRNEFIKELAKASTFISLVRTVSPEKGISRLIEAHIMSHTARSAVIRCEDLTHLKELEKVSGERINEYLNVMGVSSDFLRMKSYKYTHLVVIATIILLGIAVMHPILEWMQYI